MDRIPISEVTYSQYLMSKIFTCNTRNSQVVRIYERAVDRMYRQELDIKELIEENNRSRAINDSILNKP